ncbi:hypothetical protein [Solilutibacter pythonis]|uniref:hypothetical protein n=1 Tax=Solilutibacter pythonis TaxID=2483112 RepID=UPI0011C49194|nr:hypothetical protein [Lysobacter pythonis]
MGRRTQRRFSLMRQGLSCAAAIEAGSPVRKISLRRLSARNHAASSADAAKRRGFKGLPGGGFFLVAGACFDHRDAEAASA